ncbi:MAG: glycosyltransferase family 4 protein [Candidatus Aminicenantes bacterium]|nr:glycosyltransferase family 4 protein [Candidatus Aminicenantes bacterium]
MDKIRVLEMIDKSSLGGGQVHVFALVRSLNPERFETAVCSRADGPLVDSLRIAGIPHFAVDFFGKKIVPGRVRELKKVLRQNRIDILHTHGGIAGLFGRWAARRCRIPVVVHTLHGIHYLHYRNPVLKGFFILLEKLFSRLTDTVIFVSEADLKTGLRRKLVPPSKARLVKNGIALSPADKTITSPYVKIIKAEWGIDSSRPILGTITRLHRQKGIPVLLKAARILSREITEAAVVIIGDGPQRRDLERKRKKWGLEKTVFFPGAKENAEKVLPAFDIFVLPSLWEGLPYVLLEAAAAGKPVIASDIDGVREILTQGQTGKLVKAGDAVSLAQAAVELLRNPHLAQKMGKALQHEIPPRFSLQEMIRQVEDLYLELYEKKILQKT